MQTECRGLILFYFTLLFYGCTHCIWKFLGQGLNPSHSWAAVAIPDPFNPLHQTGDWTHTSAATRAAAVGFQTHCTTAGTPECRSFRMCSLGKRSWCWFTGKSLNNILEGRSTANIGKGGSWTAIHLQQKPQLYLQSTLEQAWPFRAAVDWAKWAVLCTSSSTGHCMRAAHREGI